MRYLHVLLISPADRPLDVHLSTMRNTFAVCLCLLVHVSLWGQGKLLLVGGGVEREGGWSDAPYGWAVQQAANHRVAIINSQPQTDWLADYFKRLGAAEATHFTVSSRERASQQRLCDSLRTYDCLFFKEGDPRDYYLHYRATPLAELVKATFKRGGVVGGTAAGAAILSEVVFTAEEGTIFPDEALNDLTHPHIQLKDDFLGLLPGYLIDTHFSERGRFARLMAFLEHQKPLRPTLQGMGLDAQTAMCISAEGLGQVHGSGAVHVYLPKASPAAQSLEPTPAYQLVQLLQGTSFDLVQQQSRGYSQRVEPTSQDETSKHTLFLSGGGTLSEQLPFLQAWIRQGDSTASAIIVTGRDPATAQAIRGLLKSMDTLQVDIVQAIPSHVNPQATRLVRQAGKLLFVENDLDTLQAFLQQPPVGPVLASRMREAEVVCAFLGDDARHAGRAFIDNYREKWASYEGKLAFKQGLGLLSTTAIMPGAFQDVDCLENTATGLPYLVLRDSLTYGIWLQQGTYLVYQKQGGLSHFQAFGKGPAILLKNPGAQVGFAPTFRGHARNINGSDGMELSLLTQEGTLVGVDPPEATANVRTAWISAHPNPFSDALCLLFYGNQFGRFLVQLRDARGVAIIHQTHLVTPEQAELCLEVADARPGVYQVEVRDADKKLIKKLRVIK